MGSALYAGAALLGLAGTPHCAAMCGAGSTALWRRCGGRGAGWAFHAGRALGYMAAGAAVAGSVSLLAAVGAAAPALRPFWALLQAAAFGLGLWLLVAGRQPAWMMQLGRPQPVAVAAGGWQRMAGPLKAGAAGSLWVAWPCGLLQSALVLAALADGPWGGAGVMGGFALASSAGLWLAPLLWSRLAGAGDRLMQLGVRAAGACLAGAALWSLGRLAFPGAAWFCS